MKFNIIYTPGTAWYLSAFIWSLLTHTREPLRFRLISNGCHPREQVCLANICRRESRLEFYSIPSKTMLHHGAALNYLQAKNREDYFCFMDCDIFATGSFISAIQALAPDYAGLFSGMPLWVREGDQMFPSGFRSLTGTFNRTETGLTVGTTFFAVYDNEILTEVMQSTGVGFQEYHWRGIPLSIQRNLAAMDMEIDRYDTGKVLNLTLLSNGHPLKNMDIPSICHVGGASFQIAYDKKKSRLKRGAAAPCRKFERVKTTWQRFRAMRGYKRRYAGSPAAEFLLNVDQRMYKRDPVRQYFLRLIRACLEQRALPQPVTTGDREIDEKVKAATRQVVGVLRVHREKMKEAGALS